MQREPQPPGLRIAFINLCCALNTTQSPFSCLGWVTFNKKWVSRVQGTRTGCRGRVNLSCSAASPAATFRAIDPSSWKSPGIGVLCELVKRVALRKAVAKQLSDVYSQMGGAWASPFSRDP